MAGRLDGKVILVTGAASGMGRVATRVFTAHGAKVVAADLNAAGLEAVLRRTGPSHRGVGAAGGGQRHLVGRRRADGRRRC